MFFEHIIHANTKFRMPTAQSATGHTDNPYNWYVIRGRLYERVTPHGSDRVESAAPTRPVKAVGAGGIESG